VLPVGIEPTTISLKDIWEGWFLKESFWNKGEIEFMAVKQVILYDLFYSPGRLQNKYFALDILLNKIFSDNSIMTDFSKIQNHNLPTSTAKSSETIERV